MADLTSSSQSASGNFRLKKPDNVQLAIPEAPDTITREALKEYREKFADSLLIIDVRNSEEFATGAIKDSINQPFDNFTQESARALSAKYKDKPATKFVFVSTQSPDLDQSAALQFMDACTEVGTPQEIFVLQGGLVSWFRAFSEDATLTQNFQAEKWSPVLTGMKSPKATPEGASPQF